MNRLHGKWLCKTLNLVRITVHYGVSRLNDSTLKFVQRELILESTDCSVYMYET